MIALLGPQAAEPVISAQIPKARVRLTSSEKDLTGARSRPHRRDHTSGRCHFGAGR